MGNTRRLITIFAALAIICTASGQAMAGKGKNDKHVIGGWIRVKLKIWPFQRMTPYLARTSRSMEILS